jgi:hypothetical protein
VDELWADKAVGERPKLFGPDPHSFHGPWDSHDESGLKWIAGNGWYDAGAATVVC